MTMPDVRPVLLIDLSAIFRAAWHANADGPTSVAFEATLGGVKRCTQGLADPLVAVCCDGKGNWRKELAPDYKAHREKQPEAMYGLFDRVKARLTADGYLLWTADGYEADDIIATATLAARTKGHTVRIATHDKDLLQLVGVGVDCLSTRTWETLDADKVVEKFGVQPSQLGDWLALVGDASDGVKGAPGVGPKRATELLIEHLSLNVIAALVEGGSLKGTPAIVKSLTENLAQVELARKLVTLRAIAPIAFDDIYAERRVQRITEEDPMPYDMAAEELAREDAAPAATPEPESTKVETTPETALAVIPIEYERGLEPTSIGGAYKLAKGLYESRLYQRFQNPEAIMAVIIRGREMGLGALTSLDCFHVIEGKPSPIAHLLIARAKADPDCEYFQCVESDDTHATWETKNRRNPKPTRVTYTVEQAHKAELDRPGRNGGASNWTKRPREMCVARSGVQLGRIEYPAATLGLYAFEELESETT